MCFGQPDMLPGFSVTSESCRLVFSFLHQHELACGMAGEPMIIKKAVCMHEEDYGTLWKHTEYRTGHSEVRRSRRLVLSFISTIANYEYGFYWYFYQVGRQETCCCAACTSLCNTSSTTCLSQDQEIS